MSILDKINYHPGQGTVTEQEQKESLSDGAGSLGETTTTQQDNIPQSEPKYNTDNRGYTIPKGERNSSFHTECCNILKRHGNTKEAREKCLTIFALTDPPLDKNEAEAVFESAVKWYEREVKTNPGYIPPEQYNAQTTTRQSSNTPNGIIFSVKNIWNEETKSTQWLIENFIQQGTFVMIFGDSGTYKSFIAIDIACSVATGTAWHGNTVKSGSVFYLAMEGESGLFKRIEALKKARHINRKDVPLYGRETQLSLIERGTAAAIIQCINEMIDKKELTEPPMLIVLDTWARTLGGDDVSTSDSAEGIRTIDTIKSAFPETTVLIVHHTGHENKQRARGASSLRAAMDCEFLVEKQKQELLISTITMKCTKQKDIEPPRTLAFRSAMVDLGNGETSLVLETTDYSPEKPKETLGKNQKLIVDTLEKLQGEKGNITVEELRSAVALDRRCWGTAFDSLKERKIIIEEGGFVMTCQ